ncbi:hypothetical protein VTH06DRAFT_1990 [Thermothelomyces fergusii]
MDRKRTAARKETGPPASNGAVSRGLCRASGSGPGSGPGDEAPDGGNNGSATGTAGSRVGVGGRGGGERKPGPPKATQNPPATTEPDYAKERRTAELLVQRASVVTEIVQAMLRRGEQASTSSSSSPSSNAAPISQYKPPTGGGGKGDDGTVEVKQEDESPVTMADYAVQALVAWGLRAVFPRDMLLGEEDAGGLRSNKTMLADVCAVIKRARERVDGEWDKEREAWETRGRKREAFERADQDLPWPSTERDVLDALTPKDRSSRRSENVGIRDGWRYWIMDPVDGTSAFLKNGQYAIMLALVQDGKAVLGVCACPNTSYKAAANRKGIREYMVDPGKKEPGVMLAAVKGQGATMRMLGHTSLLESTRLDWSNRPLPSLTDSNGRPDFSRLIVVDSEDSPKTLSGVVKALAGDNYKRGIQGYSSHWRYAVGAILGPEIVQIRCPKTRERDWKIWDHVGTILIYEESGAGKVTDMNGKLLDYSHSPTLAGNWGVIAAHCSIHENIRKAALLTSESVKPPQAAKSK